MIEFIHEYWFWIILYWSLGYYYILDFYDRHIEEKGRMKKGVALWIAILSIFWIFVLVPFLVAQFIKAGKR